MWLESLLLGLLLPLILPHPHPPSPPTVAGNLILLPSSSPCQTSFPGLSAAPMNCQLEGILTLRNRPPNANPSPALTSELACGLAFLAAGPTYQTGYPVPPGLNLLHPLDAISWTTQLPAQKPASLARGGAPRPPDSEQQDASTLPSLLSWPVALGPCDCSSAPTLHQVLLSPLA